VPVLLHVPLFSESNYGVTSRMPPEAWSDEYRIKGTSTTKSGNVCGFKINSFSLSPHAASSWH
jgi:hypothetical protein